MGSERFCVGARAKVKSTKMFKKVLVANRGEIALRIFRTLKDLGIKTVAVYSEADANAPHVWAADEAFLIGAPPPRESYLNIAKILEAARKSDAEAIHPGYGFLSENPEFAEAVQRAGLVFVGPPPQAMRALGDKAEARARAQKIGVPVVPGTGAYDSVEELQAEAKRLGMPLLLKAAAGGGGKGMRRVADVSELMEAIVSAQREVQAAFGDGRMIAEKWIEPARHIEIQIMGDRHGNVVALGERECSLQRRHQKIIEEAPSTAVRQELRQQLQEAACKLAQAVHYTNAGTVEFLLAPDGSFYFLEVNARLQVEHPITELVTGLDLVKLQIESAAGEKLRINQEAITLRGHAIEARLYAEDPKRQFLPASGKILKLHWPALPGLRIDSGICEDQTIDTHYDPLLAKCIAWAPDREQARRRLLAGLRETVLLGLVNNLGHLIELLESRPFGQGTTFTGTVETLAMEWASKSEEPLPPALLLAAVLADEHKNEKERRDERVASDRSCSPWARLGRWRNLEQP
jgi:acetyl/propionyl-CoA carboxylase alpha subunit